MRLRAATIEDASAMAVLYRRSVLALGRADYSDEQVQAWADAGPDAAGMAGRIADGRRTWVAVADPAVVVGFIDLEPSGHIDLLYVAPEVRGRGVADRLLDAVEAEAVAAGVGRLFVEASEAARRFLLRRGFADRGRRQLQLAGTPIHNYAMDRSI